jgi:hypothetical protein
MPDFSAVVKHVKKVLDAGTPFTVSDRGRRHFLTGTAGGISRTLFIRELIHA